MVAMAAALAPSSAAQAAAAGTEGADEAAAAAQPQVAQLRSLKHMSSGLRSSRKVMAALAPLHDAQAAPDSAKAGVSETSPTSVLPQSPSGLIAGDGVGVEFQLYKTDSGRGGSRMQRVGLSDDTLTKAFAEGNERKWERVLSSKSSAAERDVVLASLLDQPLPAAEGESAAPTTEQEAGEEHHLSGVCVMNAPQLQRTATNLAYSIAAAGAAASEEFRLFMQKDGQEVSPWHDVPLRNEDGTLNFICEIPKGTTAKMEVATGEERTPIKQDLKKGKLRHYHEAICWNYGLLPQTFEDPNHVNHDCGGVKGDNDPLDVVEIGSKTLKSGGVYRVRPLGAYAMIDEGELDWKVLAVRVDDPLAERLHDIHDVEREMPGELERIMTWFRDYKIPDGKPANAFGFDCKPLDAAFAHNVVEETHAFYASLRAGTLPNSSGLALA